MATSVGAGSRIASVRSLSSSWLANHVVDVVDRRGTTHRLVLRRWARPGWADDDPEFTAAHEAAALGLLVDSPVPAPEVVAADPDGDACDVPALLLTLLPGRPPPDRPRDLSSFLTQLASALPPLHAVDPRGLVHAYSPYYETDRVSVPSWSPRPELWARAIEVAAGAPPAAGGAVLIHRDYHPGNTLWSGGRMTGIVDWTAASVGSPAVDVAHMRWNLAANHSTEAADAFLETYRALTGSAAAGQPYWDVVTTVDVLPELDPGPQPDAGCLRLEAHVAAALARVG